MTSFFDIQADTVVFKLKAKPNFNHGPKHGYR